MRDIEKKFQRRDRIVVKLIYTCEAPCSSCKATNLDWENGQRRYRSGGNVTHCVAVQTYEKGSQPL